jgi:hypothetical protein
MAFGADPLRGAPETELAWQQAGGVLLPTQFIGTESRFRPQACTTQIECAFKQIITGEEARNPFNGEGFSALQHERVRFEHGLTYSIGARRAGRSPSRVVDFKR